MPNLWPSDKPLPAKFIMYRNVGILAKEDVDLDEEMAVTPTTDQEITVVDNQIINEQDGVRVVEIDQQTLNDFLDRDRRAHSSDSWPSEDRLTV